MRRLRFTGPPVPMTARAQAQAQVAGGRLYGQDDKITLSGSISPALPDRRPRTLSTAPVFPKALGSLWRLESTFKALRCFAAHLVLPGAAGGGGARTLHVGVLVKALKVLRVELALHPRLVRGGHEVHVLPVQAGEKGVPLDVVHAAGAQAVVHVAEQAADQVLRRGGDAHVLGEAQMLPPVDDLLKLVRQDARVRRTGRASEKRGGRSEEETKKASKRRESGAVTIYTAIHTAIYTAIYTAVYRHNTHRYIHRCIHQYISSQDAPLYTP
eukprot:5256742-Pyramimonas_sp.AAC.1